MSVPRATIEPGAGGHARTSRPRANRPAKPELGSPAQPELGSRATPEPRPHSPATPDLDARHSGNRAASNTRTPPPAT
ncbi:MAG: hypothetical protein HOY78_32025 [Saccharothrix sp.]|nr:hypothetical protein [Saccharothrix sp.]